MRLRFALLAEGKTEQALVDHLRTLCLREAGSHVEDVEGLWADDLMSTVWRRKERQTIAVKVAQLLAHEPNLDLLFIHRDADGEDDSPRRHEISSGVAASKQRRPYVPVVPIHETEAWCLLDAAAIRRAVHNPQGKADLGLPKLSQIERRAKPKEMLEKALQMASKPGPRNAIDDKNFGRLRRELLENLDLDGPINSLTAWQNLLRDLRAALAELTHPGDTPLPADPLNPCPPSTRS